MWNSIFGSGASQLSNLGIGSVGNPQNAYGMNAAQQSALAQQYTQAMMQAKTPQRWVIDGHACSFEEFVEKIFPADTPEKTLFILKYSQVTK